MELFRYEQQRPPDSEQQIGIFFIAGADQLSCLVDAHQLATHLDYGDVGDIPRS